LIKAKGLKMKQCLKAVNSSKKFGPYFFFLVKISLFQIEKFLFTIPLVKTSESRRFEY